MTHQFRPGTFLIRHPATKAYINSNNQLFSVQKEVIAILSLDERDRISVNIILGFLRNKIGKVNGF